MFLLSSAPACALTLLLCKLLGALWFYHVVLRQPRGSAAAAVAAAPMLCLNLVLPFFWDHRVCPVLLVAHGVAVMGWVANSKVIAYLCGRGPAYTRSMRFWEVFASLVMPASIAHPTHDDYAVQKKEDGVGTTPQLYGSHGSVVVTEQDGLSALPYILSQLRLVAVYGALLAGSMAALQHSAMLRLPTWAVQALYGTAFLAFVPMPLMGYGTLSALLARRPAVPATVSPWAPRSVSDFWGLRWNRFTGDVLRWTVYEPLATGAWRLPAGASQRALLRAAPTWRRVMAVLATFLASGLAHDAIWLCLTGRPDLMFTPYFLANAVVVVGEGLVRQRIFARRRGAQGSSRTKPAPAGARPSIDLAAACTGPATSPGCPGPASKNHAAAAASHRVREHAPSLLVRFHLLAAQVARTVAVYTVVMGLGSWLVWPRLAAAVGEQYLGVPGLTFEQLHQAFLATR